MRYVAFLRGINVGGHVVRMEHLKAHFEALGLDNVSTFIASGNVLFDSDAQPAQLEPAIEGQLQDRLGYAANCFLRTDAEIADIAAHQPFPDPGTVYVLLLRAAPPAETRKRVLDLATEQDLLAVHGREIYWRPTSFAESPVSGALNKILGSEHTARNANTLRRLAAKCTQAPQAPRRSKKTSGSPSTLRP